MDSNQPVQGLYDIYPLIYVPFWHTKTFFVVVAIGVIGVLATALWWYLAKRRVRALSPWEIALQKLALLEFDQGRTHFFYEQVTYILKHYLEYRYGYRLSEKTDEEVAAFVATASIPDDARPQLKEIFKRAVVHKFGNIPTTSQQMVDDKNMASLFIQQTIPDNTSTQERR